MESATAVKATEPVSAPRTSRRRTYAKHAEAMPKTPESELMTVEEYFGLVWQRYLEKYENLQGKDI